MRGHGVANVDREKEPDRLRPVDRARAGQTRAHQRREERRRQHSMKDPAAETRSRRELVVGVKRIRVLRDLDEPPQVIVREGLTESRRLPGLEVFDSRDDWNSQGSSRDKDIPVDIPFSRIPLDIARATTFAILALELALIRWIGGQIRIFAYFANLVLLAGFLGMGLGIALGRSRPGLVRASLPLLALVSALLAFSPRLGLTYLNFPDPSVHLWGAEKGGGFWTFLGSVAVVLALFWLVAAVFLTAAAPIGWLFDRLPALTAYSADLLGSLLGVIALAALAALDTTPVIWIAVVALPLLAMARSASRQATPG
jgi:hypothetical protein